MIDFNDLQARLQEVFSPGAPIDSYNLFAGRVQQVSEILNAVRGRGQHAILFGERGVGKTSLGNVLSEFLGGAHSFVLVKVTAGEGDTFAEIWRRIGREFTFTTEHQGIGFNSQSELTSQNLEPHFSNIESPDDARYVLQRLNTKIVIVIDEFDRPSDRSLTKMMADCIKTLSDNSVDVTLIIIGVADSIDQLIQEHASVERALVQIRMPRMSRGELEEVIEKAVQPVGIAFTDEAKTLCVELSQGLPHFTHLLGLLASEEAVRNCEISVTREHVAQSIQQALDRAQQSVKSLYHTATMSPRRDNLFKQVLTACALSETDSLGYFAPADVRSPLSQIMTKPYEIPAFSRHLKEFCSPVRGPILERTGPERRYRYRFINPMMQPFVILNAISLGLISSENQFAYSY